MILYTLDVQLSLWFLCINFFYLATNNAYYI